jgi:hypothetical protein
MTESEMGEVLESVSETIKNEPSESLEVVTEKPKKSNVKSSKKEYSEHPKFAKFKKGEK